MTADALSPAEAAPATAVPSASSVASSAAPVALRRWRAWAVLLGGSLLLNAVSLTVVLLAPVLEPGFRYWRLYLDVLVEDNLPTWWSAALLVTAALTHGLAGVAGRLARAPGASCWFVSAAVLAVLALDDHTQLHERSERIGRQLVTFETFPFAWLIPGAVAGLGVAGALVWLAARTCGRTRWLLVAGVTVLLGCALGLEAVQGLFMADHNEGTGFVLTYHVEELGENVGALLLHAAALSAVSITREHDGLAVAYAQSLPPTPAWPHFAPGPLDRRPAGQGDVGDIKLDFCTFRVSSGVAVETWVWSLLARLRFWLRRVVLILG